MPSFLPVFPCKRSLTPGSMKLIDFIKRNHYLAGIILILGVVSVGWLIWFAGATKYQSEVDRWIAVGRSEGYEISFDKREQFGFPKHTVLRFSNVRWKNTNGITFKAGDLDISAELWQTRNFLAKFKDQVEIDVPLEDGSLLILAGQGGSANVTLADDGTWQTSAIDMRAASVGRTPDYLFMAQVINLSASRPAQTPKSSKEAGLTLSVYAEDLALPPAMSRTFGPKISQLAIDLRLMGAVPDFRKKESVMEWNRGFGVVDFDKFDLNWGPLLMTSKGTMGFDDDLEPEGAFAAQIAHTDEVLAALAKEGYIAESQSGMLSSSMKIFAKPVKVHNEDGVEVPVAVQLGGFFLGPVKIFSFPPIGWE